eukprot:c17938_g1_i2 orf=1-390(-)
MKRKDQRGTKLVEDQKLTHTMNKRIFQQVKSESKKPDNNAYRGRQTKGGMERKPRKGDEKHRYYQNQNGITASQKLDLIKITGLRQCWNQDNRNNDVTKRRSHNQAKYYSMSKTAISKSRNSPQVKKLKH